MLDRDQLAVDLIIGGTPAVICKSDAPFSTMSCEAYLSLSTLYPLAD
jgi:hypothetical protein